jgi:hypothetical protein
MEHPWQREVVDVGRLARQLCTQIRAGHGGAVGLAAPRRLVNADVDRASERLQVPQRQRGPAPTADPAVGVKLQRVDRFAEPVGRALQCQSPQRLAGHRQGRAALL